MTMKLNRSSYEALIAEDIVWLMRQPRTLERDHILAVLQVSADHEYGPKPKPCASCGAPATHECQATNGMICGAPLCDACQHSGPILSFEHRRKNQP